MKILILSIIIFTILSSCDNHKIVNNQTNYKGILVTFTISDTNGVEKHIFKSTEEFVVDFKVTNHSGEKIRYFSGMPVVSYSIFNKFTVVATSMDFMGYAAVMVTNTILNGEVFTEQWIGPNTMGRKAENDLIELNPGNYQIGVTHTSLFSEYRLPQTEPVQIEIIE